MAEAEQFIRRVKQQPYRWNVCRAACGESAKEPTKRRKLINKLCRYFDRTVDGR